MDFYEGGEQGRGRKPREKVKKTIGQGKAIEGHQDGKMVWNVGGFMGRLRPAVGNTNQGTWVDSEFRGKKRFRWAWGQFCKVYKVMIQEPAYIFGSRGTSHVADRMAGKLPKRLKAFGV